eukprot:jgi/Mesvir1/27956/Mv20164-RA.1
MVEEELVALIKHTPPQEPPASKCATRRKRLCNLLQRISRRFISSLVAALHAQAAVWTFHCVAEGVVRVKTLPEPLRKTCQARLSSPPKQEACSLWAGVARRFVTNVSMQVIPALVEAKFPGYEDRVRLVLKEARDIGPEVILALLSILQAAFGVIRPDL